MKAKQIKKLLMSKIKRIANNSGTDFSYLTVTGLIKDSKSN